MDDNSECGWIEPCINIYEVANNVKNRRTFRTIARDICGESMEPARDLTIVLFGDLGNETRCVASCRSADESVTDSKDRHFYHWIDFLFVHKDFQGHGYGTHMVLHMEQMLRLKLKRPVRVESAERSVGFFQKLGYRLVGRPEMSVFPSCHLFKVLQLMEKFNSS
ncbi:uncharacterized protein LOC110232954 [Exaiptasia diaphana]|uniref:N-acetyltransferase domain-containing protein n=1 Tax=Exaiptasia diaphana TaxID=2652724 RepID=A0A913WTF9_EXADI|nr:uncharacterized protein LOC110232954 [Exaiptasia diaphana]KXJ27918.1 hypothetical protein AC249_AIPGENE2924 [Exaiptasia diaphana]